jgi:hypothetical protein
MQTCDMIFLFFAHVKKTKKTTKKEPEEAWKPRVFWPKIDSKYLSSPNEFVTKKTLLGMEGITSKYLSSPNGLEQKQKLLGKEGIT